MIAVDTSTWVAFSQGSGGDDTELLDQALTDRQVVGAYCSDRIAERFQTRAGCVGELPGIAACGDRAGIPVSGGLIQGKVLRLRRKARLGDALIAQSCLDARLPLLTWDGDFRAFAQAAGLNVVIRPGQ